MWLLLQQPFFVPGDLIDKLVEERRQQLCLGEDICREGKRLQCKWGVIDISTHIFIVLI